MQGKVEIDSEERVFDDFLSIDKVVLRHEKFDGTMSNTVTRLCMRRGDAVAAILFNPDTDKVILVKQFRYPIYQHGHGAGEPTGWIVETLAGVIKEEENSVKALCREITEETGYVADTVMPIMTFYVSPGGTAERIFLYYAEVRDKPESGGGLENENEDIQIVEMSLDELQRQLRMKILIDAKTIIAATYLLTRKGHSVL